MEVALVLLDDKAREMRPGDTRRDVVSSVLKKLGKRLKKGESR
jgi:hypothetical protein